MYTTLIKEIICAAFYSPPKSRKNSLLLDHLVSTSHHLLSKYLNAGLVLGGDKKKFEPICSAKWHTKTKADSYEEYVQE